MNSKIGDLVDIVAPSSKCHISIVNKTRAFLASWGLECQAPEDLFGESLLYANSDEKRFQHLKNAILNPHSKVIWCLLGGFGASKLIPLLEQMEKPAREKLLIGFSDITALHIFWQRRWGWRSIHGPSGYQASLGKVSSDSLHLLKDLLFTGHTPSYQDISALNDAARQNNIIRGPIVGGNLHLIETSLGTSWQIDAVGKIVLIEEVNERAYRVDRALAHLQQAGVFRNARAILFGDMIDKGEPSRNFLAPKKFLVAKTVREFAKQCSIPVLQISNVGHGPVNNPILLGHAAELRTGDHPRLEFMALR